MTVLVKTISEWKAIKVKLGGKTLGFVPTMGNLHAGHLDLLKRSISDNEVTVLSCFINPTQFNSPEDFEKYPRTLEKDVSLAKSTGVDYVFAPDDASMYPDAYRYRVVEKELSAMMEGSYRPGHFEGVLTVVLKLLLLIRPDRVYFGEKDYQQLQLVQSLSEAFFLETKVVPCKVIRDAFGLPLSSRHGRLTEGQMKQAREFPKYFHSDRSCEEIKTILSQKGFKVDYVTEYRGRRYAAVFVGDVRLIDNISL